MLRQCAKCKEQKDLTAFYADKSRLLGRGYICKVCSRARLAAWQKGNPEKLAVYHRKHYQKNREHCKQKSAEYRSKNPEQVKAAVRNWRAANPDRVQEHNVKRLKRLKENGGSFTPKEWKQKCEQFSGSCAYCGQRKKLTVHHVVPVSKGGPNTIQNCVPACGSCNSKIGTKTVQPGEATWA